MDIHTEDIMDITDIMEAITDSMDMVGMVMDMDIMEQDAETDMVLLCHAPMAKK